jgi:acylpyruvate hydrolase
MKILCIGRNYVDHIHELQNAPTTEPMLFLKPATALRLPGQPFLYPAFSQDVHYELELVLQINRTCCHVTEAEAELAWDSIALGLDFTARDLQTRLKKDGHPWEIAKAFDGSAPVSRFLARQELQNPTDIVFELQKNGSRVQLGHSRHLIYPFATIIAYASRYFTLEPGDLVFTGTPAGVGPVQRGDALVGFLENTALLDVAVC